MGIEKRSASLVLALIVLAAAVLRFNNLGGPSLWVDEAASLRQSSGSLGELFVATAVDNYPPLHNLILFATIRLLGDGEWALRLPSALLGTLNVFAIYLLVARLGGRGAGLFAALMLALSGYHVWYSQEARMYALLACAATFFGWTVLRFMADATAPRWPLWVRGIALLYSHPFGTLTWLAILVGAALASRVSPGLFVRPLKRLLTAQIVIVLAFAPWALVLVRRAVMIRETGFWIPPPTPDYVWLQVSDLASGPIGLAVLGIGAALALIAAFRPRAATPPSPMDRKGALVFLAAWVLLPALLALVLSLVGPPIFISRYLIGSLPALIGIAAIGLAILAADRLTAICLALVVAALMTASLLTGSPARKTPFRDIATYLQIHMAPGDCLVTVNIATRPLHYYMPDFPACAVSVPFTRPLEQVPSPSARTFLVAPFAVDAEPTLSLFAGWNTEIRWFGPAELFELTPPR